MADVQVNSVSVEDGRVVVVSPKTQKSNKVRLCLKAVRTPLFILISLALFGLSIEAYFINRLYYLVPPISTQTTNTTGGNHLIGNSDICGMDYKDGQLVVQNKGHYYVYSKTQVSVRAREIFLHSVKVKYPYYDVDITLMQSNQLLTTYEQNMSNSYLGGVFYLDQDCHLFVTVIPEPDMQNNPFSNFFGAFMI
ncbi:hypothetical protein PAMP_016881 [Pampus punctatissimus]